MQFNDYKSQVSNICLDDYSSLLNIGRKWKKIDDVSEANVRIAVLGTNSIQLITSVLRAMLTRYDLYADVYEGEYNGIMMDVFDSNSKLYSFNPNYIILLPDYRDVEAMCPPVLSNDEKVNEVVTNAYNQYEKMYDTIHKQLPNAQILITNFITPIYDPIGSLSNNYSFSSRFFYRKLNLLMTMNHPSYVYVLDVEDLAEYIGKKTFINDSAYFLNKSGFDLQYIGLYCDLIARQFEAFAGRPRKCLVLDLDNTLWGGVVGDLGYDGIQLDPNDAEGEAFLEFQKYILKLKNRGIIISICSKNDEANAKEPFMKNEHMLLSLDDISSFVANWDDKATNIKRIASELNIGTDSMVFFDDNPTERALIQDIMPEVKVINVPDDPALYVRALDRAFAFEWTQITEEDTGRIQTYSNNRARQALMDSCVDYEDFLRNLHMKIECKKPTEVDIERFVQLTGKTNQFNLRTIRYTEAEIIAFQNSDSHELLIKLEDKFSKYGIIGCVVLTFNGDVCFIENWVMSCRVLKKGVENYTIERIVDIARQRGCRQITSEYIPTKKNSMVSDLYEEFGFELVEELSGIKKYVLAEDKMEGFKQEYFFEEVK